MQLSSTLFAREAVGAGMTAAQAHAPGTAAAEVKLSAQDVRVFYGAKEALHGVSLDIYKNEVIAFIGPSGCGKSTLLRCFNRMNDTVASARVTGRIAQVKAHDAAEVERLLATLRESGVRVEDLEIGRADLEDVFMEVMAKSSSREGATA